MNWQEKLNVNKNEKYIQDSKIVEEENKMLKIYNILEKMEFLKEVAKLEYEEWADKPEEDKESRIKGKIEKIKIQLKGKDFCKLILLDDDKLIGFISIFPQDCDECPKLSPWYATMYVKKEYRGQGYSPILNYAILKEARKRGYKEIYLKTTLNDYYEKFGAIFVKKISEEKIYKFEL